MHSLNNTFAGFIAAHPDIKRFWVALSGGLDSCVLLHLLSATKVPVPVQVLHINHQISPNADAWQAHCEQLAQRYGCAFTAERVSVSPNGGGLERAAREARYAVFERTIESGDMLLLAHHLDDQAETLLLRLLRGTGIKGLGAMAPVRSLGAGLLGRPLLNASRAELKDYAQRHGLAWVEDESNRSLDFDRNYLRSEILPLLDRRWPAFHQRWAQTASLARETEALLADYVAQDLMLAQLRQERLGQSICLDYLARLPEARRNALLRHWIQSAGHGMPERVHLQGVDQFLDAAEDAQPTLGWGDCELRRYGERLYLLPRLPTAKPLSKPWDPTQDVELADGSRLRADQSDAGLRADQSYQISLRQGGERCRPHNRAHSQTLKKLLQEHNLEPWLRDRIPLIYAGDQLAAVGDLWVCGEFYTEQGPAFRVRWDYQGKGKSRLVVPLY